jgi:HSP20 family protein
MLVNPSAIQIIIILRESAFGHFSRRIHLPFDVQADKVKATYKDGVLNLEIPKITAPKAKKDRD